MRILLTGKNGQVGFELQRALAPLGDLVAVDHIDCDFADDSAIRRMVVEIRPQIIVNSAAYTAVDKAESDIELVAAVNALAPRILAEEAKKLGALLIHYSTDYVFDGSQVSAYVESDQTNPQSVYGRTKRDGEEAVRFGCDHHLVLRTSWVVGAHGGNFAKTILRLAAERDSLSVVADQWGAPTSAALLADVTAHLVRQWSVKGEASFPYGTYHVVAGGETNWCDYAKFVIDEAAKAGKPLKISSEDVKAICSADYPTPAKRPINSRLDTSKFRLTFNLELPHWQQGVGHVLQKIFQKS